MNYEVIKGCLAALVQTEAICEQSPAKAIA